MPCMTYVLSLRPNKRQQHRLCETLGTCRALWNLLLEEGIRIFRETGKVPSAFDLNKRITILKETHPELREVHSDVLQDVSRRVNAAFARSVKEKDKDGNPVLPKERSPNRYRSFEYISARGFSLEDGKLFLGKMMKDVGGIHCRCSRDIKGDVKNCIIVKKKNHWYAHIVCEIRDRGTIWFDRDRPEAGLDLGLTDRATLSDGTVYKHDKYESIWEEIGKIQQKMSELEPGTARYEKLARRVANRYQRMANLRQNELRHVAKDIAENHEMVAIEDIDIKKLVQKQRGRGIHRSQYSASWGRFVKVLRSAAEAASSIVIEVDPRGTSQDCSGCGRFVAKDLSVRIHRCPYCGLEMDRDVNAALNILAAGRAALASSHRLRG